MKRSPWTLVADLFATDGERRHPWLVPYLVLSIVTHLIVAIVVHELKSTAEMMPPTAIEVVPLIEEKDQYRLADIPKPAVESRPDKAKFLGMHDASVPEEMVASGVVKKGRQGESGKERAKDLLRFDKNLFAAHAPDKEAGEKGASRLDDFYPDYRHGAHTYLNVLRYPEVEYFVRLKRAFKLTFNPGPSLRRHFMTNQIARGSVEVVMAVSVNREGELAELFVLRSSGIEEYDAEGLRTVRASSPFPSPPEKFLDDGLLRMSWTFTVYL